MHILVIEDEKKVAGFINQALIEEGHTIEVAYDGVSGLDLALHVEFDLVILDWMLPQKDGLQICSEIRDYGKSYPILMLTAKDTIEDRVSGLDMGADDYLTKPFALSELLARVRALLRRSSNTAIPLLVVSDLVLDPATRAVKRGSREIWLSAREYSLLDYLMRNAGRTVTRTLVLEHVWDFTFDGGTNVVDVYINYLRNKIDRGQKVKLIHTIRGIGYSLSDRDG